MKRMVINLYHNTNRASDLSLCL